MFPRKLSLNIHASTPFGENIAKDHLQNIFVIKSVTEKVYIENSLAGYIHYFN